MLIDWFTVGAQALNFLILVFLLKRLLYKPILRAVGDREKRIAEELANADARKAEAQKESDEYKKKNEEFDLRRAELLSKAADDARAEGSRLLEEARKAADALSSKRREALNTEEQGLRQSIVRRTRDEVFAIARKAMADLATTDLEGRMVEAFVRRLRAMEGPAKAQLAEAVNAATGPVLLRSAFDLPEQQRAALQKALDETFSSEVRIRFETAPDLIGGIELAAEGQKVGWGISEYLTSMEGGIAGYGG